MSKWIPFLSELADISEPIAQHYFQKASLKVQQKSNDSPVTEADLEIEKKIRDYTEKKFPDMAVLGEEFEFKAAKSNLKLIIDPIDGTRNFVLGIPFVGTLLAIEEGDTIIAGLVSSPLKQDRWWAEKGQGAFLNGQKIQVSAVDEISKCHAFHSSLWGSEATGAPATIFKLLSQTYRQRGFGDYYAPLFVAQGCGEIAFDFNINPWDMAPHKIITEEAGGKFTDLNGTPTIYSKNFVITNGLVHQKVLDILNS